MTKTEALQQLDKLDEYWREPHDVRQYEPTIYDNENYPCGCFGAHCAVALDLWRDVDGNAWDRKYCNYCHGMDQLELIANALGIGDFLHETIIEISGSDDPFGSHAWAMQPYHAWPKISEKFRKLAAR